VAMTLSAVDVEGRAAFAAQLAGLGLSFPRTFPPGVSQNLSTTPLRGRRPFSAYGILSTLSKSFSL
jgi:hypothetical protein